MSVLRKVGLVVTCVGALCCREPVQSPTAPTATTTSTKYFSGVLDVGAARFYSFTVSVTGSVTANLASVTPSTSSVPMDAPLRLGVGIPQGTGCALLASVTTPPTLVSQLDHTTTPGIYCIEVADVGNLTATARFALRFTHP